MHFQSVKIDDAWSCRMEKIYGVWAYLKSEPLSAAYIALELKLVELHAY